VEVSYRLEYQLKAEKDKVYAAQVYKTILDLKSRGFDERDICILTRSKKDGVYIGEYLMEMKVPVISAETLLLQSSQMVQCLVNTLQISSYPENNEAKINLLDFLHSHFSISELQHTFFSKFVNTSAEQFEEILKEYHIDLSFKFLQSKSLYEGCEYLIRQYRLQPKADAYLFSFMDFVFEFENSSHSTKDGFLDTWELHQNHTLKILLVDTI
jgi:ATP-dependent exoDNAse (exonuclease V) beta subunit